MEKLLYFVEEMSNHDDWQPALYRNEHAFVFQNGASLVELMNPQRFELVLDLGCGTGELTYKVSSSGCFVIGVDSSSAMTYSARNSFPEIEFIVADGTFLCFRKPLRLLESVHDCLLPGKPFVAELGGEGNVESITTALCLATEQHTNRNLLGEAGFTVIFSTYFDRLTKLQKGFQGLRNWLSMFCPELSRNYSKEEMERILETVETELRSKLFDGNYWYADYKRIRIVALRNE
ncbi:Ovarian cancer-associated gene 2 protein [Galdieria sulphuraria]|nr:Ovarian cancer-associated gene 2 protein [Galdieria sulphuraria]